MRAVVLAVAFVGVVGCAKANDDASRARRSMSPPAAVAAAAVTRAPLTAEERRFYLAMAAQSWRYLDAEEQPATGLVNATPDWPNTTLWDIGGQLVAVDAAHELGLLSMAEYDRRTRRTLTTIEGLPLYAGVAFNKVYSTRTGALGEGTHGWSATDLGRFLVAIKIVSIHEPQFADQIARIVHRIDFTAIVRDGYLHGQMIGPNGAPRTFQEGRIGYEQYAAAGFGLCGRQQWAEEASDVMKNARPVPA